MSVSDSYLSEQAPEDLCGFQPHPRFLKRVRKRRDLFAIPVRKARMQPQGRGLRRVFEDSRQLCLPDLQFHHLRLHQRVVHPVLYLFQRASGRVMRAAAITCGGVESVAVYFDEGRDQIGVEQLLAQTVKHSVLDLFAQDNGAVLADSAALVERCERNYTNLRSTPAHTFRSCGAFILG